MRSRLQEFQQCEVFLRSLFVLAVRDLRAPESALALELLHCLSTSASLLKCALLLLLYSRALN